jgi:hypothetical protein
MRPYSPESIGLAVIAVGAMCYVWATSENKEPKRAVSKSVETEAHSGGRGYSAVGRINPGTELYQSGRKIGTIVSVPNNGEVVIRFTDGTIERKSREVVNRYYNVIE